MRVAIREQRLVVDREERASQRREHRQLVVRPLDRGQRAADRFHLFTLVKRFAADEQVRHAARFERVDVRAGHVGAEVQESPEQDARRGAPAPARASAASSRGVRSVTVQPLSFEQPVDERADGVGQRFLDRVAGDTAHPVRLGNRQRDHRRLVRAIVVASGEA